MELTEAELEEGRYLLEKYGDSQDSWTPLDQWMWEHRRSLLARREEIAREAVREFAEELAQKFDSAFPCLGAAVREFAARGVTLDEKR